MQSTTSKILAGDYIVDKGLEKHREEGSEFSSCSDFELWKEFKKGKKSAFIFIYNRYFEKLYVYGHQFTPNSDLIKDCIQDVFVAINISKSRLSNTDSIHLYLFKSLRTKIIKELKKRQKQMADIENSAFKSFNIDLSIEQKIINRQFDEERIRRLNDAVNRLSPREREAIFYYYYENFKLVQIKQLMGFKSLKGAQNLIYRAIKSLRELLLSLVLFIAFHF